MAYKYPEWFVYEQGDFVYILPEFQKAFVKQSLELNPKEKTQTVLLSVGKKELTYNTKELELIRSVR